MRRRKNIVSLLFAICFFTLSLNQCIVNSKDVEDPLCHGFILSLVVCKNTTTENQINCKIKHIVNDLLREQIPVYWTTTSVMVLTNELEQNFDKGTFIIPFTGDAQQDTKLTAIVYDYNQSSEIEENNIKIPVYELMEPLNAQVYQLSEAKIAIFKGSRTSGESFYLDAAEKCGFLTFEYLEDKHLAEKLNNTKFNVLIWPAGDSYCYNKMLNFFIMGSIDFASNLIWDRYNIIRNFVGNGGGYIGSCYGAYVASCGIFPVPIYFSRRAYNPKLPAIGLLAVSDVLAAPIIKPLGVIQERIVNNTHPVTYGLQTILTDGHFCGPRFVYVGENSQVVATFYNVSRTLDGTPSWVSSRFGNGKVMIFSGHPEFIDSDIYPYFVEPTIKEYYVGKKIISNALYYTTSKKIMELDTSQSRTLSFILEMWDKTSDMAGDIDKIVNIFDEVKMSINETLCEIPNLTNEINLSIDVIRQIENENNIDKNSLTYLGKFSVCYTKQYTGVLEEYLKNTLKTINTLEKIYPLIQNDMNFGHQIKELKTDLLTKVNETRTILAKSLNICINYKEKLQKYQQNKILSKLQEYKIQEKAHELVEQITIGFQYTPQAYFNSLKFLRHHWYDYESMC